MFRNPQDGARDSNQVEVKTFARLANVPSRLDGRAAENRAKEVNHILQGNKNDAKVDCPLEPPRGKYSCVEAEY